MGPLWFLLATCLSAGLPQDPETSATTADEKTSQQAAAKQDARALETLNESLRRHDRPTQTLGSEQPGSLGWLLIDWGGWREQLADHGLAVEVLYTTDGSWAARGGADPDGTALRSLLDVALYLDAETVLGWKGGLFHADVQWITGVDGSTRFGVLQDISNIDADRRIQLARFWYGQEIGTAGARLRVGKIDANSLFAYVNNGAYFINASMGFSPTILGLPTYPDAAYGAAFVQPLGNGFELRAGAFDGSGYAGVPTGLRGPESLWEGPQDAFLIGELDYGWESSLPGRAGLGVWGLDGEIARFDGGEQNSTGGVYAVLDQRLWQDAHDPSHGLGTFLQLGLADAAVSPFIGHVGTGLVLTQPFTSLSNDCLGVGVTHAQLSDEPGAGFTTDNETTIELFLGFEALPWMSVKPDLQYVIHPGGDALLDNAWIATLRVTLGL